MRCSDDIRHIQAVFPKELVRGSALPEAVVHRNLLLRGGGVQRKHLCDRIAQQATTKELLNLAGKTTLLEAAAVIKNCDLLICNDSGTMHLANAVGTDVFALFGPTVKQFGFAPFRPHDEVFEVELYCRPCSAHGGQKCPEGHFRCMLDIQVLTLYNKAVKKLNL